MSYQERREILDKNGALATRHFQYRVKKFFKVDVLSGPLGITQYYAIRDEVQVRGSSVSHSFILILNGPKLSKLTK